MSDREGKILVTGANGFVGRHVCRILEAETSFLVRAAVRDASVAPVKDAAVVPDFTDRKAVRAAVDGVRDVVHLAARVHVMAETADDPLWEFRRVNVHGTQVLLEESIKAGVSQMIFTSSVKAVAEKSSKPLDEATPPQPADPYGRSKLEAEEMVKEACDGSSMGGTTLRFPLIYGPGMGANMLRLFRLVDLGVPLPFASIRNERSILFVGNAVAAIRSVLRHRSAGYHLYFVSDGPAISTPRLIREIALSLERPAGLFPFPVRGLRALVATLEPVASLLGHVSPSASLKSPRRVAGSRHIEDRARSFLCATLYSFVRPRRHRRVVSEFQGTICFPPTAGRCVTGHKRPSRPA